MAHRGKLIAASICTAFVIATHAEADGYHRAPAPIDKLIVASSTPHALLSPPRTGKALLAQPYGTIRTIAELAAPELRLAGLRFNPEAWATEREPFGATYYKSLSIEDLATSATSAVIGLPDQGKITSVIWSPDGTRLVATISSYDHGKRHGIWIVDTRTARAQQIANVDVNSVLGSPCEWLSSSQALVCRTVPADRGPAPVMDVSAIAPATESSSGKAAPGRTYEDLLQTPFDEQQLAYHMSVQLAVVGLDGSVRKIGAPGLYDIMKPSPDGQWLLASERVRPFSYQFPLNKFPQRVTVTNLQTGRQVVVAEKPLESEVPIAFDAVGPGSRDFAWRSDVPATLTFVRALDDGSPSRAVPFHDEVMTEAAPFADVPKRLVALQYRFHAVTWNGNGPALVEERWRKTRLRRIWALGNDHALYSGNSEDRYGDPGNPMMTVNAAGAPVAASAGAGSIWFESPGGTPAGDRPFVARLDLRTGARTQVWRSSTTLYENPRGVLADGRLLIRREGIALPPNYFLVTPGRGETQLTHFPNPYGDTPLAQRRLLHYQRADGVPLTAMLYLPPNYKPSDGPLPTILHAYPAEFKSREAASQVKGPANTFPVYGFYDLYPLMAQRGYAVLFNAAIPIIGEGDAEPNDTFIEQLVAGAKAAIDEGVRQGVVDRNRVGVTGHSYGAFMTANLLAHSDLFKAGVALSGAYNRTLTPFGFQNETRTYWQAPDLYFRMSPFSYADKIKAPLDLIHGMADDNQGTFPVQSERFYAALKGHGVTTRLTFMPLEAHRYDAVESLNQVIWEWDDWFGRYVKGNP